MSLNRTQGANGRESYLAAQALAATQNAAAQPAPTPTAEETAGTGFRSNYVAGEGAAGEPVSADQLKKLMTGEIEIPKPPTKGEFDAAIRAWQNDPTNVISWLTFLKCSAWSNTEKLPGTDKTYEDYAFEAFEAKWKSLDQASYLTFMVKMLDPISNGNISQDNLAKVAGVRLSPMLLRIFERLLNNNDANAQLALKALEDVKIIETGDKPTLVSVEPIETNTRTEKEGESKTVYRETTVKITEKIDFDTFNRKPITYLYLKAASKEKLRAPAINQGVSRHDLDKSVPNYITDPFADLFELSHKFLTDNRKIDPSSSNEEATPIIQFGIKQIAKVEEVMASAEKGSAVDERCKSTRNILYKEYWKHEPVWNVSTGYRSIAIFGNDANPKFEDQRNVSFVEASWMSKASDSWRFMVGGGVELGKNADYVLPYGRIGASKDMGRYVQLVAGLSLGWLSMKGTDDDTSADPFNVVNPKDDGGFDIDFTKTTYHMSGFSGSLYAGVLLRFPIIQRKGHSLDLVGGGIFDAGLIYCNFKDDRETFTFNPELSETGASSPDGKNARLDWAPDKQNRDVGFLGTLQGYRILLGLSYQF